MLLAEAQATQLAILLSFDLDFVGRLGGRSNVLLMKPLDCWRLLDIPKGSPPKTIPTRPIPSSRTIGGYGEPSLPSFRKRVASSWVEGVLFTHPRRTHVFQL